MVYLKFEEKNSSPNGVHSFGEDEDEEY